MKFKKAEEGLGSIADTLARNPRCGKVHCKGAEVVHGSNYWKKLLAIAPTSSKQIKSNRCWLK
jgi:hypothetical protein